MALDYGAIIGQQRSPLQNILGGIQAGTQLREQQERSQEVERQRIQARQMQTDLAGLAAIEKPTTENYLDIIAKYPQLSGQFKQSMEVLGENEKKNVQQRALNVYSALNAGQTDVAKNILEEYKTAALNSDRPDEAKAAEIMSATIDANPDAAKINAGLFLASTMGSSSFSNALKSMTDKAEGITEDIVQSSRILDDGTTQIVRKSGAVEVIQPNEAARELVKNAQIFGASLQGLRSGERKAGEAAIAQSTKFFEKLEPIQKNIQNMNEGIRLIDEGAKTGVIQRYLPSVRKSSVELDNLQKQLGLDVLRTTTFGALSEKELAFALDSALPKGLNEQALKQWLIRKREAQKKLANYLSDAALFLGTPGNTITDYLEIKKGEQEAKEKAAAQVTESPAQPKRLKFNPATGKIE